MSPGADPWLELTDLKSVISDENSRYVGFRLLKYGRNEFPAQRFQIVDLEENPF